MSSFQACYSLFTISSLIIAIITFFVDGMLLYSIGFLILFLVLVMIKVTWNVAGWAERVTRKLGEE